MGDPNFSKAYIQNLIDELKTSKIYTDLQFAAQVEIAKPTLRLSELKKGVLNGLVNSGWDRKLRNAIYRFLQTHPKLQYPNPPVEHLKEPLVFLRKAQ
ncbi:TBC1 domain family member 19-like, partial [Saccostrea cucullata]|uniref:TBC1 domain family member 19-like n=1 Tax=Saccostrea cuccullata TaxID=36930 RepID=UPI002ED1FC41